MDLAQLKNARNLFLKWLILMIIPPVSYTHLRAHETKANKECAKSFFKMVDPNDNTTMIGDRMVAVTEIKTPMRKV